MQTEERPVEQGIQSLDHSLSLVEQQAQQALTSVNKLGSLVKGVSANSKMGDLRSLRKQLGALQETLVGVGQELARLEESWPHTEADEEAYLASGSYMLELQQKARQAEVGIYEQEGYWACYPSSLKLL